MQPFAVVQLEFVHANAKPMLAQGLNEALLKLGTVGVCHKVGIAYYAACCCIRVLSRRF